MSIAGFDFELDGVGYMAATDAEGDHYAISGEPLRPPNAITVQGETSQKFQMRPDTLKWSLTDWSGGEGQEKYDASAPNRHRELTGVRVFERPGTLQPGYPASQTQIVSAGGAFSKSVLLISGAGSLWGFDLSADDVYEFSGTWDTGTTLAGVTSGAQDTTGAGDKDFVYWIEAGTNNVFKFDGTTVTKISDTLIDATTTSMVAELNDYVYVYDPVAAKVWEIPKTGAAGIEIDSWTEAGFAVSGFNQVTTQGGKVYVQVATGRHTIIREITPTSAASVGFGAEIGRFAGLFSDGLWSHSGLLFMKGRLGIMYLDPVTLTFGTLGRTRTDHNSNSFGIGNQAAGELEHFYVLQGYNLNKVEGALVQIDSVSGGYAIASIATGIIWQNTSLIGCVEHAGSIYSSSSVSASGKGVVRFALASGFSKGAFLLNIGYDSQAVSAWHDFDLADEKILSSLVISMEALPADWTVTVDYATDGSGSKLDLDWTEEINYSTTNGVGTKVKVSTDTNTVKFRTLSIRIGMEYDGGDNPPTTAPVILGVDVLAMVAKPIDVFRLILDCSDDKSGGPDGTTGAFKISNIRAASATEDVVSFKDGFESRDAGAFTEYDMIVDSYRVVISTPGEGVAEVVLKAPS